MAMPGKYPVYVCVPASRGAISTRAGTCPQSDERSPEPVGIIRDLWVNGIEDADMLERDGYDVKFFVRQVTAEHGCVGALIMAAVEVPTWEAATKIRGFLPIGHFTGAYWVASSAADF